MRIADIIRENIKALEGYSCARGEFRGTHTVLLDANESPFETGYNRYPDPYQAELKEVLAGIKSVAPERMVLGNGSDELIDLLIRVTCEPGRDNIIVFSPGYSMYEVWARVSDVEVRRSELGVDFLPEWEGLPGMVDGRTKLIFFCTPNNPVGNVVPLERVREVAGWFPGLVVVDEAYVDFSGEESAVGLLEEYRNVVVLQTLSKAWGMAGLRVGLCMAHSELVEYMNRVKPPYNIGSVAQAAAIRALAREDLFRQRVEEIKRERERLYGALRGVAFLEKVFASEANFILVCTSEYEEVYRYLVRNGVVVRKRNCPPRLNNGLRLTVGTREENDLLIGLLNRYKNER